MRSAVVACATAWVVSVGAQSLDERLDERALLETLNDFRLREVLNHYAETRVESSAIDQTLYQIARRRIDALDPEKTSVQRARAIEDVLQMRATLIESHPFDSRAAVWMADQAEDYYFLLFPIEATEVTTLFGVPGEAQRARAERVAREMKHFASEAELSIADTIMDLEAEPGYASDIGLQLERRRLVRDERDRRIPFLHGVASYLHGALVAEDRSTKNASFTLASELLASLLDELDGQLWRRAQLYLGLARARLGDGDAARAHFDAIVSDPDAAADDRVEARFARVLNEQWNAGPEAARVALEALLREVDLDDEIFYRVLAADRAFLIRRDEATEGGNGADASAQGLAEAYQVYLDLLDADVPVDRATMQAIVFDKLASTVGESAPLDALPPIVTVARAANLARDAGDREEAIALLRSALDRSMIEGPVRAIALFELASALYKQRAWEDAARIFLTIAREHPREPQAEQAIEFAVTLLLAMHRQTPASREVATMLNDAFATMFERYPNLPNIDQHRYDAARFHLSGGRPGQAGALLGLIPPGSDWHDDARVLRIRAAKQEALGGNAGTANRARARDVIDSSVSTRASFQQSLDAARATSRREQLQSFIDELRLIEAELHLALDEGQRALALLEPLVDASSGEDVDVFGAALALRIKAYQSLGQTADARREVEQLLERAPERAEDVVPSMISVQRERIARAEALGRDDEAKQIARDDLLPLAQALDGWLAAQSSSTVAQRPFLLQIADSYRLAGLYDEALSRYERVLTASPDALRAKLGQGESLFGLGRYAEAMAIFRRIAATRREQMDDAYWKAELRMLQCLDRAEVPASRKQQILPRIEQLRQLSPSFGGPQFQRGFNALELKYRQR